MDITKLVLESTKGGRTRATVTRGDGETVAKSFRGLSYADIVNGHIHPPQLDAWKKAVDDGSGGDESED